MLTAALRVYHWDRRTSSISSDRLEDDARSCLEAALGVYRRHIGRQRGHVRNAARLALDGLRPDRVEPVIKLLDDVAIYDWPPTARCADRRVRVFETAARRPPLADAADASLVVTAVLDERPAGLDDTVALLYADYPEFHRLTAFPADYTAEDLQAAYDLGQAQALLYAATRIVVDARGDFKRVLRYARLARLLHRIERTDDGYRFRFDGPNSVLRKTRAYGVDFARFLAALVRLTDWTLTAEITLRRGWRPFTFTLSADDGLGADRVTPLPFDSALEEAIARKLGRERDGWRLRREAIVLESAGGVLVPDFVFRHDDGTEVVLEIAGYWTPEYVEDKLRKLAGVRNVNLIVAVPQALALRAGTLPADVLPFRRRVLLRDLLPRLEAFRR